MILGYGIASIKIENGDGIHEVTISIPQGATLVPLPEGNRYLGFILARGATPERVEDSLREAHAYLQFGISELSTSQLDESKDSVR